MTLDEARKEARATFARSSFVPEMWDENQKIWRMMTIDDLAIHLMVSGSKNKFEFECTNPGCKHHHHQK